MLKFISPDKRTKKVQKTAYSKLRAPRPAIKLVTIKHKSKKDYDRRQNKIMVNKEVGD